MKAVFLDGNRIENMAGIHAAFSEALDFPEYYGANLDALHDMLTEMTADDIIVIAVNTEKLASNVGKRRWKSFLRLMGDMEGSGAAFRFFPEPFPPEGEQIKDE